MMEFSTQIAQGALHGHPLLFYLPRKLELPRLLNPLPGKTSEGKLYLYFRILPLSHLSGWDSFMARCLRSGPYTWTYLRMFMYLQYVQYFRMYIIEVLPPYCSVYCRQTLPLFIMSLNLHFCVCQSLFWHLPSFLPVREASTEYEPCWPGKGFSQRHTWLYTSELLDRRWSC